MMRKGITPIISIIILLLITVGLAAAAWTYMSNYFSGLTAKQIEITSQTCIGGNTPTVIIHNIGTADLDLTNEVVLLDKNTGNRVNFEWCNIDGTGCGTISTLSPGAYVKGNSTTPCTGICSYDLVVGGRSYPVVINCPG